MENKENKKQKISAFICNGTRTYAKEEREINDYYATQPKATELLLKLRKFEPNIWECCYGEGHIGDILENNKYKVYKTDIIERSRKLDNIVDFLQYNGIYNGDIITNPPYKIAEKIVRKALEVIPTGNTVAMFLKLTFLESKSRKGLFKKYPPKIVYVSSSRLNCAKNGDFERYTDSAVAYAWYIWEKGYTGDTVIKWFN